MGCCKKNKCCNTGCGYPFVGNPYFYTLQNQTLTGTLTNGALSLSTGLLGAPTLTGTLGVTGTYTNVTATVVYKPYNFNITAPNCGIFDVTITASTPAGATGTYTNIQLCLANTTYPNYPYYGYGCGYNKCYKKKKCCDYGNKYYGNCGYGYGNNYYGNYGYGNCGTYYGGYYNGYGYGNNCGCC